MPIVPKYQGSYGIGAGAGAARGDPGALRGLHQASGDLADAAMDFATKYNKQRTVADAQTAIFSAQEELQRVQEELATRPDPYPDQWDAEYKKRAKDISDKYGKNLGYEARQIFDRFYGQESFKTGSEVRADARKRWITNEQGAVDTALDSLQRELAKPEVYNDPNKRQAVEDQLKLTQERAGLVFSAPAWAVRQKKFRDDLAENMVLGWVTRQSDPVDAYARMRSGNFGDDKVAQSWNVLTDKQRETIRKNSLTQASDFWRIKEQEREQSKRGDEKAYGEAVRNFSDAMRDTGSSDSERLAKVNTALGVIRDTNPEQYPKWAAIRDEVGAGGVDDPDRVLIAERGLQDRTLTMDTLLAMRGRGMSYKTSDRFIQRMVERRNEDFNEAMTYVKNALGYPDKNRLTLDDVDRRAEQRVRAIENEMIEARRAAAQAGKPFDPFEYVRKRADEFRRFEFENKIQTAKDWLNDKMPSTLDTEEKVQAELRLRQTGKKGVSSVSDDDLRSAAKKYKTIREETARMKGPEK